MQPFEKWLQTFYTLSGNRTRVIGLEILYSTTEL